MLCRQRCPWMAKRIIVSLRSYDLYKIIDTIASASIVWHLMALNIDFSGFRPCEVSEGCSGIEYPSKSVLQSSWFRYSMAMKYFMDLLCFCRYMWIAYLYCAILLHWYCDDQIISPQLSTLPFRMDGWMDKKDHCQTISKQAPKWAHHVPM